MTLYKKSIPARLEQECSGNYKKVHPRVLVCACRKPPWPGAISGTASSFALAAFPAVARDVQVVVGITSHC